MGSRFGRRGPVSGLGCAIVFAYGFLNELFKSEKRHCPHCQVRDKKVRRHGEEVTVKEVYRPFFQVVHDNGLEGFAIASGLTEMDAEMDLLMQTEPPRTTPGQVDVWSIFRPATMA